MAEGNVAFTGTVPASYDRGLGQAFFEPYAADIVKRIPFREGISILETACGTGIVTKHLRDALPPGGRLVATDLNEAMIDFAIKKIGREGAEWQEADATALPFPDKSFDAVICQFGIMFVPDKVLAMREAHRVLKEGGKFVFNVWDGFEPNDFGRIAHQTILSFFAHDPPRFFETPYGYNDQSEIRRLLSEADFGEVKMARVESESVSPSADEAAKGLVQGTPVMIAITQRDPAVIPKLTAAVAKALTETCGNTPCRGRMRAQVWEATR